MNDIMKDVTGVAMAIVGVAILYTLVSSKNQTPAVINAVSQGFAGSLTAAMGGGSGNTTGGF